MQVSAKDKRIKQVMASPAGTAIKGLQPVEADRIRTRIDVLLASTSLTQASTDHQEWRVHQHRGKVRPWSIDVLANTRLLFDYDAKGHIISGMYYYDPH